MIGPWKEQPGHSCCRFEIYGSHCLKIWRLGHLRGLELGKGMQGFLVMRKLWFQINFGVRSDFD